MSKSTPIRKKIAPLALGVAVLAAAAMPLAVAGADQSASASASKITAAKFKKLKQRVAQLEARSQAPTGPAGGDLTGTYPNPEIAPNTVGSDEIAPNTVGTDEIIDDSVGAADLAAGSVGFSELTLDSVGSLALAADSVGSSELKGVIARVGTGAGSNNNFVNATATCNQNEIVVGGGYAWTADVTGITMIGSAPATAGVENNTWTARGKSPTSNTLFAWANCLAV